MRQTGVAIASTGDKHTLSTRCPIGRPMTEGTDLHAVWHRTAGMSRRILPAAHPARRWCGILGPMTSAPTVIARPGPAIRVLLAEVSPAECAEFERDFAAAAEQAGREVDIAPLDDVLHRWWRIAAVRGNPLTDAELAMIEGARSGDFKDWRPGPDGL